MTAASVTSCCLVGVEPTPVHVEAHVAGGKPLFSVVGLPDTAVREAKERVRAAITSSGYPFPSGRVTVNLSPADVPKAGSAFDLPIALGVLAASRRIPAVPVTALGELGLDGAVRDVRGGLAAALVARDIGTPCLLPGGAARQAAARGDLAVSAVRSLAHAVAVITGSEAGADLPAQPEPHDGAVPDLVDVRGQEWARRALEIAAAGGHHLLLRGAPGCGKTMLARALPGIIPRLDGRSAESSTLIWAAAGLERVDPRVPPFRSPHHSVTLAALIGGGTGVVVPGEAVLAHHGVLFLDELGEFPPHLLNALRQPLEDGAVTVARKGVSVRFPSRFQLIAATNPCPCGYEGDRLKACSCTESIKARYAKRLAGPLLDRVDLRVEVGRLRVDEMAGAPGEPSAAVRTRVEGARARMAVRGRLNRDLDRAALDCAPFTTAAIGLLTAEAKRSWLTGRGWDRVRRVAVTIADLTGSASITDDHIAEALLFRGGDG
jgi:magnesium chelatase family protein